MKKQFAALACRRRMLLDKIGAQRMEVAEISRCWKKPLARVDAGLKAVRFLHKHRTLLAGGVAALLALRRKGIAGLTLEARRFLHLSPVPLSPVTRAPGVVHRD